jgi:hypothetical protein
MEHQESNEQVSSTRYSLECFLDQTKASMLFRCYTRINQRFHCGLVDKKDNYISKQKRCC